MNESRHLLASIALGVGILLLGGAILVWPNWRETARVHREIADLQRRVSGLDERTLAVERLATELEEARRHVDDKLKFVPESPDVAGLMRKLSLPVDGVNVLDQTFTAGSPGEAVPNAEFSEEVLPLTVDMDARFDSIIALIRSAELMDRLIRVASVRLVADRADDPIGSPILTASVGLDVIYDPPPDHRGP